MAAFGVCVKWHVVVCHCLVFELYLESVGFGVLEIEEWCWRGGRKASGGLSAGMEVRVWVMG